MTNHKNNLRENNLNENNLNENNLNENNLKENNLNENNLKMKQFGEVYKNIILLTQFGLSLITPLLLCLGLCWWLTTSFGFGGWIFIPGFFFGMGGSGMVAYKLYLSTTQRQKKENTKKKISFNTHE